MTVCIGSTTLLSDPSGSGVWSSSNTVVASVSGGGVVTGSALGTAIISYTAGSAGSLSGCSATAVVTINSLPDALSIANLCAGSSLTLTDLPGGGTWSSSDESIAALSAEREERERWV